MDVTSQQYDFTTVLSTPLNATIGCKTQEFLTSNVFQASVYIMYITVFIVALLGNGLVCIVIKTTPRMKTATNYFIMNLAIGDILMTILCVPFSFISTLVLQYWPFGAAMCKIVNYAQAVSVFVSAYTLLAISLDRYMAITQPLKPRLGTTAAKIVVATVWFGALATASPLAVVSKLILTGQPDCEVYICTEQWENAEKLKQYTCALLALQFVLPLVALVCTYTRIACIVWDGRPPGEAHCARDSRMQRSKLRMVKMMVIVVAAFILCWLPLNVFIMISIYNEQNMEWRTWSGMPYLWFACHWLAMSHSCYNPVIYCYMNERYWRGFKQVMECLIPTRSNTPNQQRSSLAVNHQPLSEMLGPNGAGLRRGTASSLGSQFNRATTRTSCSSSGRGQVGQGQTCIALRSSAATLPVRAVSVRPVFN